MPKRLVPFCVALLLSACQLSFEPSPIPDTLPPNPDLDAALDEDARDLDDSLDLDLPHELELEPDEIAELDQTEELDEADSTPERHVEELLQHFAEVFCQQSNECLLPSLMASVTQAFLQHPQCPELLLSNFGNWPQEMLAAEEAGLLSVDVDQAIQCIDTYVGLCKPFVEDYLRSICRRAIQGGVAPGERCWSHWECGADHYCSTPCPGVCTPMLAAGESCSSHFQCDPEGQALARCLEGVCVPMNIVEAPGEGASCGESAEGRLAVCPPGLFCINEGSEQPSCALPIPDGQSCRSSDACQPGSLCLNHLAAGLICQPSSIRNEGEPCPQNTDICNPLSNLYCLDGNCVARGDGSFNAACIPLSPTACDDGLYCAAPSLSCTEQRGLGEACANNGQCESGYCNGTTCVGSWCW